MNHCLFKAKDTKGAVGNTVDYSSLTMYGTAETGHCVYHDLTMIIKGCFQIIYYESPGRQPRMSHACMSEFTGIGRASRYEQGAR